MADKSDQERGTQGRLKAESARPRVEFVPVPELGVSVLAKVQPREEIRTDEIAITASPKSRSQQLREQAETVIAKAAKGQHFKDEYLGTLQQELGSLGKEDRSLTAAVGDVRASQAKRDAARAVAPNNRAPDAGAGKAPVTPVPRPEAEPAKPPSVDDSIGSILANARGNIAAAGRIREEAEARGLYNRWQAGERVSGREARRRQQRLLSKLRQAVLLGDEDAAGFGTALALSEVGDTLLAQTIQQVAKSASGGDVDPGYLDALLVSALTGERQAQLLGTPPTAAVEVGDSLVEIKRTQLEKEANDAASGASVGEGRRAYLQERLLGGERQSQLLGRSSTGDALESAGKLAAMPSVPLEEEAADVVARAESGERFSDGYVDFLRRRLSGKAGRDDKTGKQLEKRLLDMQRARLKADVTAARAAVAAGQDVSEPLIDYLTQRAVVLFSEPQANELTVALDALVR